MKNIWRIIFLLILTTFVKSDLPNVDREKAIEFQNTWFPGENVNEIINSAEKNLKLPKIQNLEKEISFRLYTKETGSNYELLKINDVAGLKASHFNPHRPTRFFSHGWRTTLSTDKSLRRKIRKAFLENENCNLIMITWYKLSFRPYIVLKKNTDQMAKYVASFINFLEMEGMNLKHTTLVGFSLGAHLVGVTGYHTDRKVDSIIGLDPSWYLYNSCDWKCRISTKSGKRVEIIHTNDNFLGTEQTLGHVDFYPNGGSKQPGCIFDILGLCSHHRALFYYLESLTTKRGFYGMRCRSYEHYISGTCKGHTEIMGGVDLSFKKDGIFYLTTNSRKPYAQGKHRS